MSSTNCSFCSNKGISGPHGHSIRDFTKKDKPITCPELLSITCNYCHENGHTVKYCDGLKAKKNSKYACVNKYSSKCFVVQESRSNKRRDVEIDDDGFVHMPERNSRSSNNFKTTTTNTSSSSTSSKSQKLGSFANYFAALDIDNPDNSDSNMEEDVDDVDNVDDEGDSNQQTSNDSLWSRIVSTNKRNVGDRWGERSDDDDDVYCGDNLIYKTV